MTRLFVLTLVVLLAGCATQSTTPPDTPGQPAGSAGSYYLLPDTASPQGTYAIGWGVQGNSQVDWKRLENGDDAYLDSLIGSQMQNVRVYIVNKQSGQIVCTLQGVRYFKIGNRSENHGSLTAAWTADEQLALVVHGGKWTFQSFDGVTLRNARLHRQTNIGTSITTAIGNWLAQHYPAEYPAVRDKVVIDVSRPVFKAGSSTMFTADIIAAIPKAETGFMFEGKGTFQLQRQSNGSVSVSLVSAVAN